MPYSRVVRAVYNYGAAAEDELSFDEDDLICIFGDKDESWLDGRLLTGDKCGLVPANYVEPVEVISRALLTMHV